MLTALSQLTVYQLNAKECPRLFHFFSLNPQNWVALGGNIILILQMKKLKFRKETLNIWQHQVNTQHWVALVEHHIKEKFTLTIRPYIPMSKMTQISTLFFILKVISMIRLKSKHTLFNRVQSLSNDDITVSKSLILSKNSFSVALFIRGKRRASTHWPYKWGHTQMPRSGNKCPGTEEKRQETRKYLQGKEKSNS